MSAAALAQERVWFEKSQYAEAGAILNGACPVKQNGAPQLQGTEIEPLVVIGESAKKSNKKSKKNKNKDKKEATETTNIAVEEVQVIVTSQPPIPEVTAVNEPTNKQKKRNKKSKNIVDKMAKDTDATDKGKNKQLQNSEDVIFKATKEKINREQKRESKEDGNLEVIYSDIAKLRQLLSRVDAIAASGPTTDHDKFNRIVALEKENATLRKLYDDLKKSSEATEKRVQALEQRLQGLAIGGSASSAAPVPAAAKPASAKNDDDDDMDLFGSDSEEDEAAAKVREQRLADYAAKKSKKPALIAKSNIILDVKPWDDETDMKAMETEVRKIVMDGLLWGASKLVPLAYGIKKLQISCVVEDDKVSIDLLTEQIEGLEDLVQSVDVAAFNKI